MKLKIPSKLYRQATVERDAQNPNKVRLSVSSDEPYKRWDFDKGEYYEVLDHGPGGIIDDRLKAGISFLFNHDPDVIIGRSEGYDTDGHKCYVEPLLSEAEDVKSHVTKIKEGILRDSSVGYEVIGNGREIGKKDGLSIISYPFRIFETSTVSVPADFKVGFGRMRQLYRKLEEESGSKEIEVEPKKEFDTIRRNENNSQNRENSMTPEEQAAADEKARKQREADEREQARERGEKVQEGIKAAREREKEIRDIATRATVPDEKKGEFERVLEIAIEKAVTDEKAVSDFQTYVFKTFWGKAKPIETPSGQGNGDLRATDPKNGMSLGRRFVESESFKRGISRRAQGERVASIDVDYPILGIRGKVAMAQRAGFTSSDLAAVNVQIQTGVIGLGVQRLTIMDLIAPGATSAAAIIYPQENSFGTVDGVSVAAGSGGEAGMPRAKAVGERGIKPLWEPDLTTVNTGVKKVAITTKVPDEFMSDFPAAQSYIDERLPYMVDTETEFQLLYGDGLGNNLKGIFTYANVQTRVITTTDDSTKAASLLQGLTDIRVGSFFEPDGYAFHPYDWETAKLLKDSTGRFLAGGPYYIPYTNGVFMELNTFWGKPVVVSTAVNYRRPLAGCWKLGAQYFLREGMRLDMTNANEDDFRRNLIMLRAEHRLALAVYRPLAFIEYTGFPARN